MLVAPSDHVIPDAEAFRDAVNAGAEAARAGRLVTFGIQPTRPETGYGWLELETVPELGRAGPLTRFVEKPDAVRAAAMLADGRFLLNAGIFLFSAETILDAFRTHAPGLMDPVARAVENGKSDLGFFRLAPGPWAEVEDISIDYAVMERAENLSAVPFAAVSDALGVNHYNPAIVRVGNGYAVLWQRNDDGQFQLRHRGPDRNRCQIRRHSGRYSL